MKKTYLSYFLISFIVVLLGSYFRLFPFLYRISSGSEEKAVALIYTQIRSDVEKNIERLYPGLGPDQKRLLADQKFSEVISQKKKQIQQSIFNLAQRIYGRELLEHPEAQEPEIYLPDSDSYYFYGMTKQLAENKKIMQPKKGAEYFNPLMQAPIGYWEKINLHPFVGYYTYKLFCFFNPKISLMLAISFVPIFLTIVSILLFLLLLKELNVRAWASLLGSLFFVLAPLFLRRSFFGWYDNDIYNIFFPLLILWLTLLGVEHYQDKIKRSLFALLSGLSIFCYAFFWQGWVYLFCVVFAGWLAVVFAEMFFFKEKKQIPEILSFLGIAFATLFIGIIAAFGLGPFFFLFKEGWSVLNDFFLTTNLSLWPDIYMSVGELSRTSWPELLELTGSLFWLLASVFGILGAILDNIYRPCKKSIYKMIFVFIFFLTALILGLKAQRFILLFITPLGLFAAYGFEKIFTELEKLIKRFNPYERFFLFIKPAFFIFIIFILALGPVARANDLASRIRPIFNDVGERALVSLKEKTPAESIINTWWPPGHFIKAIAERRVVFDGATINVPQAYWMARALYSPSEIKTLGILRMLNTSANKASEYLLSQGKKLSEAVTIIEKIVVLPPAKAKQQLLTTLSSEQADTLLSLTHGQPPPSYLFLYNDMMETNIGIGFAARWNMEKMEQINRNPDVLKRVRRLTPNDYVALLWDMQGGMLRYSEILNQVDQRDGKVYFNNGLMLDLGTMSVQASSGKFGNGIPKSLFYESPAGPAKKEFLDGNLLYSVFLFKPEEGRYACILLDDVIAESSLAKLYFWGTKSFRYIKPLLDERDLTGRTQLFAFKIDWEKFLKDLDAAP